MMLLLLLMMIKALIGRSRRRRRPWRLADTDWFNLFFARITIHGENTGRAFHFTRVLYISIDHLSIYQA